MADEEPLPEWERELLERQAAGLPVTKAACMVPVSQEILDDFGDDLFGKFLRGEIEPGAPPPERYHRCLACWLVSLLPGHDRCEHGYLACDDCRSDY
jgi:hypothetical protein